MLMKMLKAPHMERCIGCWLCVLQAGNSSGEVSFGASPIRIVARGQEFVAEIDLGAAHVKDVEKIAAICPRNCLSLEEVNG